MNESRHDLSGVLGDVVRALVNGDDAEADARMATIAIEPRRRTR